MNATEVATLCREHEGLVRTLARQFKRQVGQRAEFDDLVGDGNVGLVKAARAWSDRPANEREFAFEAWATTFIRRAMVDGIRRLWKDNRDHTAFREAPLSLDKPIGTTEDGDPLTLADTLADQRADVLEAVLARETFMEKAITRKQPRDPRERRVLVGASLTPMEAEALAGAATGESAKVTAARLGKSTETVKSQRKAVIAKLGAADMTNAVFLALRDGALCG